MTRLGLAALAHVRGCPRRRAGHRTRDDPAELSAEAADADPWEVLQATLAMPDRASDETR